KTLTDCLLHERMGLLLGSCHPRVIDCHLSKACLWMTPFTEPLHFAWLEVLQILWHRRCSKTSTEQPNVLINRSTTSREAEHVSTSQSLTQHFGATVPEAGKAAGKREQKKFSKYKDIAKAAGMTFQPLVHKA